MAETIIAALSPDSPRERIIGTECEYDVQHAKGQDLANYINEAAIAGAGLHRFGQFLGNGARLYPDLWLFLEYASPECLGPRQAAAADLSGAIVLERIVAASGAEHQGIYRTAGTYIPKLDADGNAQTSTCGYHENYQTSRAVTELPAFDQIIPGHLASRIWAMNGGVHNGFVFSQKVWDIGGEPISRGLEPSSRRTVRGQKPMCMVPPLLKDSDILEDPSQARVEVRFAEPGLSPTARFLSLAATSLVLRILEHESLVDMDQLLSYMPKDPVAAAYTFAQDLTLRQTVETLEGGRVTALDIQRQLAETAAGLAKHDVLPPDELLGADMWIDVCDQLQSASPEDCDYGSLVKVLDIAAKHRYLARHHSDEELQNNAFAAIQRASCWGRIIPTGTGQTWWQHFPSEVVTSEAIEHLTNHAPATRAAVRAHYINHESGSLTSVSWARLKMKLDRTITLKDPYQSQPRQSRLTRLQIAS